MEIAKEKQLAQAIGWTLAQARATAGMTQDQVAKAYGIGAEAISRMERGLVIPSLPRLVELAELFGCSVESLVSRAWLISRHEKQPRHRQRPTASARKSALK